MATAAILVSFCCNTEPLGRTDRLSSEPADLAGKLHASFLFRTTQSHRCSSSRCTSARNLVASAGRMSVEVQRRCPAISAVAPGVLSCRTAEGEKGRKVLREMELWKG